MRTTRRLRMVGFGALTAALLLACPGTSQADVYLPYPGLPEPGFVGGAWQPVSEVGIAETAKALQWVAVPAVTTAAYSATLPTEINPEPGVKWRYTALGDAAFVSPPGAPHRYGHLAPLRVRTVGYGLIPVEATVQVSQRRVDGRPIPVRAQVREDRMESGAYEYDETHIEDAFEVRVTRVLVDGVDIGLTGRCRTVRPAPVDMVGPAFVVPAEVRAQGPEAVADFYASLDPATYFQPLKGGQLSGTVDIPAFTGCTTRTGDDLSPMITASVSGPGNRVVFRIRPCPGKLDQGTRLPPAPGEYNPARSGCAAPDPIPYPTRE